MNEDASAFKRFFSRVVPNERAANRLTAVIGELANLIDYEASDAAVYYQALLGQHPDAPVEAVEFILQQRDGIQAEVLEQALADCRTVREKFMLPAKIPQQLVFEGTRCILLL